jgi:hypothetical protein
MMIARGDAQTVNAFDGGIITGADGASITIEGGSFVDQTGNPIADSDNIVVTITPVDISTTAGIAVFPGEFSGVPENETTESPIASYGVVEYELTLENTGEKVQLADDETAEILIPLYNIQRLEEEGGGDYAAGDSIALWSLNESTGIWKQEGSGTVVESDGSPTGLALQASASHFTWWNCDVTYRPAKATITVLDPSGMTGTAVIRAVTTGNIGGRPKRVDTVIPIGGTTLPLFIPSNGETCFWAEIIFDTPPTPAIESTTDVICKTPGPDSTIGLVFAPSPAPLEIIATPKPTSPIIGKVGIPIDIIHIRPSSKETRVNCKIDSGTLPPGMGFTLESPSATKYFISGKPTVTGNFTVTIKCTDVSPPSPGGNMDFITLDFSIK